MSDELYVVCRHCGSDEGLATVEEAVSWHNVRGWVIEDGELTVDWNANTESIDGDWNTIGYVCQTCEAKADELDELAVVVTEPIQIERWVVNVTYLPTSEPYDWPRRNEESAREFAARCMQGAASQTVIRHETVTIDPR